MRLKSLHMLKIINSIGQRKFSKFLFLFSLLVFFSSSIAQKGLAELSSISLWMGIVLMASPVGIFSLSAQHSKDYRLFCIGTQSVIILLNAILFFSNAPMFLFILTLFQIITSFIFYTFVKKKKNVRNSARESNNLKEKRPRSRKPILEEKNG